MNISHKKYYYSRDKIILLFRVNYIKKKTYYSEKEIITVFSLYNSQKEAYYSRTVPYGKERKKDRLTRRKYIRFC